MTIWDDICKEVVGLPSHIATADDVIKVLEMGVALTPITCAFTVESTRLTFVKLAATAVRGIELMDDELVAKADEETQEVAKRDFP